jgi:hypothetical protein
LIQEVNIISNVIVEDLSDGDCDVLCVMVDVFVVHVEDM